MVNGTGDASDILVTGDCSFVADIDQVQIIAVILMVVEFSDDAANSKGVSIDTAFAGNIYDG